MSSFLHTCACVMPRTFLPSREQGGDLSAGTQVLPVGKIIEPKVFRKDNTKV